MGDTYVSLMTHILGNEIDTCNYYELKYLTVTNVRKGWKTKDVQRKLLCAAPVLIVSN